MKSESTFVQCSGCGTANPVQKGDGEGECIRCGGTLSHAIRLDRPVALTDLTFADEVLAHPGPVLVDCWAEWCAPCGAASRIMDRLAGSYAGRVKIAKLNVDQNPEAAVDYDILSLPTLLLFKAGRLTDVLAGEKTQEEIVSWIDARI